MKEILDKGTNTSNSTKLFRKHQLVLKDDGRVEFVSTKDSYTGSVKEGSVVDMKLLDEARKILAQTWRAAAQQ